MTEQEFNENQYKVFICGIKELTYRGIKNPKLLALLKSMENMNVDPPAKTGFISNGRR